MAGIGHSEHYYNLCDRGTSLLQKFDIVSKIRYCIQKGDIVCKYWRDIYNRTVPQASSSFRIAEFFLLRYACIVANVPVSVPLSILTFGSI